MSLARAVASDGTRLVSPWSGRGWVQFANDDPIDLVFEGKQFCGQYPDVERQDADGDHWAVVVPNDDTIGRGFLIQRRARSVKPICDWRPFGAYSIRIARNGDIAIVGPGNRDNWRVRHREGSFTSLRTPASVGNSHSGFAAYTGGTTALWSGNGVQSAAKPFGNPALGGRPTRFYRTSGAWIWAIDPEHGDQLIARFNPSRKLFLVSTDKSQIAPAGREQPDGSLIVAINLIDNTTGPDRFIHSSRFTPLEESDMPNEDITKLKAEIRALEGTTKALEAGRVALVRELRELSGRIERLERDHPPPPPGPELPPPSDGEPMIDLAKVVWHREDVSEWVETSRIESVTIEHPRDGNPNNGRVCFPHTMAGKWPVFNDEGNVGEGNVWVLGLIEDVWHAAPAEWLKPGQTCKRFTNETSTDDTSWGIGPHTKQPPLETWGPKSGEWIGIMVSCPARSDIRTKHERSNVYMVRWP